MKELIPFFGFLLAFYLCYIIIPVVIRIAHLKNLVDVPNGRTSHQKAVPTLGGIGIFMSFCCVSLLFSYNYFIPEFNFLILGMLVLFFFGVKDDILVLSPRKKMIAQIVVALVVTIMGDVRITSFHGILNIYELPYIASVLISSFIYVALINAINLIDGIDGLASGFGILATLAFGVNFYLIGHIGWAMLSFSMTGALLGFFLYNVYGKTHKIFMGDTGSLVLGLFLTVEAIRFIEINSISDSPFSIAASPAIAMAVLFLPIFDTIRIFSIRIANGTSPFRPDKKHLHHVMLRLGLNHKNATYSLVTLNAFVIGICCTLNFCNVNINFIILSMVASALITLSVLYFLTERKKKQKLLNESLLLRKLTELKSANGEMADKTLYN